MAGSDFDKQLGNMQGLFETFFGKGTRGPTVAPPGHSEDRPAPSTSCDVRTKLALLSHEAQTGAMREVAFERLVRCRSCRPAPYRAAPGCTHCQDGFRKRGEKLRVRVPPGVATGTQLRLAGKGNESGEVAVGDALVEIVLVPSRWERLRARARESREKGHFGYAFVMLVPLVLGAAFYAVRVHERASLAPVGSSCVHSEECRSGQCLALYRAGSMLSLPGGETFRDFPSRIGGVCTQDCATDSDCPAAFECAGVESHEVMQGMPDLPPLGSIQPNARACSPRLRVSTGSP